ncbi:MAG: hypothetical protein KAR85_01265 [Methanosarcinales archaeon]|nr:hypothetical protein [Methanosarcinales archaeon]
MPEHDLFDIHDVSIELSQQARIHNSVSCSKCREPVMETKVMKMGGKHYLIIPCFN